MNSMKTFASTRCMKRGRSLLLQICANMICLVMGDSLNKSGLIACIFLKIFFCASSRQKAHNPKQLAAGMSEKFVGLTMPSRPFVLMARWCCGERSNMAEMLVRSRISWSMCWRFMPTNVPSWRCWEMEKWYLGGLGTMAAIVARHRIGLMVYRCL